MRSRWNERRSRACRQRIWAWSGAACGACTRIWLHRPVSARGPRRTPWVGARPRPRLHAVGDKAGELGADAIDRHLLAAVPGRHRVDHAEDAENRQAGIEVGAKLATPQPFLDDVFEHPLQSARPLSDPPAAFGRQVLALVQEHPDKAAAVRERGKVRFDEASELVGGSARSRRNCLRHLEETGHTLQANELERPLLGGEIVIETRLSDAEHVGDVLGRRTVEAALGEDARGGLDDLRRTAARAWSQTAGGGKGYDGHGPRVLRKRAKASWSIVLCHGGGLNSTY